MLQVKQCDLTNTNQKWTYDKRIEQHKWFPTGRLMNVGAGGCLTNQPESNTFGISGCSSSLVSPDQDHVLIGNMLFKRWHHQEGGHLCVDIVGGDKPGSARHGAVVTWNPCNWMEATQWWVATKTEQK